MMWGWGPDGWGGWLAMMLTMVAFWGFVIAIVVWAVRQFRPGPSEASDALSILRQRFARGEIDREEFEERRAILEGR
jgi:putative membrane protein